MKKVGRYLSLMLVVIFVFSVCIACGGSSTQPSSGTSATQAGTESTAAKETATESNVYPENGLPKDTNITLKLAIVDSGNGKEFKQYAADTFQKKFPNVKFEITYNPNAFKIVDTKIQANAPVEEMFDIIEYDKAELLIQNGKLEPLDDLWERSPYDTPGIKMKDLSSDVYYNTSFDSGWPDGKKHVSSFPFMGGSGGGLYFDKKLFEDNGWNQDPKTWDEFLKLCEAIKSKGIAPIVFAGVYPDYLDRAFGVKAFELAEMNNNKDAFIDNFRNWKGPQFTNPENIEVWNRIYDMGKKGYFADGIAAMDHTQSQMMVLQDKAAMVATGTWVGNEMKDATPEGFVWGYMAVPFISNPDQTIWITMDKGWGYRVWAAKPDLNKKWAKEFILWMENMDIQEMMAEKGGIIPTIRNDYTKDQAKMAKVQQAARAFLDYTSKHKVQFESKMQEFILTDPAAQQAKKLLLESYVSIATGKKEPGPVLQQAETLIQQAIAAQKK